MEQFTPQQLFWLAGFITLIPFILFGIAVSFTPDNTEY